MKAEIRIIITENISVNNLPTKQFIKSRSVILDLPIRGQAFVTAVDALLTEHLVQSIKPIVGDIELDMDAYIAEIQKTGKQQLELPLDPALEAPAAAE